MILLIAFLVGGALCALAQVLLQLMKERDPFKVLILLFCIGGLLGPTGAIAALGAVAEAGVMATVVDPGAGVGLGIVSLMAGEPAPLIILFGAIACMIAIGLVTGAVCVARARSATGGRRLA